MNDLVLYSIQYSEAKPLGTGIMALHPLLPILASLVLLPPKACFALVGG
jgi:hypothetical protein